MSAFFILVAHEVRLVLRGGVGSAMAILFFVVTSALFPLGIGPELDVLARIGAGVLWVCALLAALLALERLFQADFEDGTLDQLALSPLSLEFVVLAKCAAHWLTAGLPLVVVAPLLGLFFGLQGPSLFMLVLALALGTPTLSLLGGVGAALVVGARRASTLLALLVLPLAIPVLIFGAGAVEGAGGGYGAGPPLLILGGLSLGALVLAPVAGAAALRLALD